MPTLRYAVPTLCLSCFNDQKASIPRGCPFIPAANVEQGGSGYMKYKTGHKVRLSCENCGCDALAHDPRQMPEYMLEVAMAFGGNNGKSQA